MVTDAAGLAALEPQWWELWRRSPGATPFQSPAWLLPWWDVFHPGDLRVATAYQRGRLVGLTPLYLEAAERGRRLLPLGIGISDYLDVLVDPEAAGTAPALCRQLATGSVWDEWEMPELSAAAAVRGLPCPERCGEELDAASLCPVLSLEGGKLAAILPKRKQRKLRMAHRRLGRREEPCILAADPLNVAALIDDLVRLNRQRHSGPGEASVFEDARLAAFHRLAAPRLLAAGLLRFEALLIGSAPAAIYYGFFWNGRAYAYLSGFDAAFTYESPGSVLIAHAIESALAEGARDFDFLRGEEAYKAEWGAVPRRNHRRLFRRSDAGAAR